jgi:hypothetical protein
VKAAFMRSSVSWLTDVTPDGSRAIAKPRNSLEYNELGSRETLIYPG